MTFLDALWPAPNRSGCITLWFFPSKHSFHFGVNELPLDDGDLAELRGQADAQTLDVYFGLGLRREGLGKHEQGGKKEIIAMPGFALDIDFFDPQYPDAHKATNLPTSSDEAIDKILCDGPVPTAVVFTGFGIHVYWLFHEPLIITNANLDAVNAAYKAFQEPFIARGAAHGWQVDLTATVNRVWRLPGFVNRKCGANKEVVVLDADYNNRFDFAEFNVAQATKPDYSTPTKAVTTSASALKLPREPADLEAVHAALKSLSSSRRFYEPVQKTLRGESMAEPGARDIVLQGVCSTIAWLPEGRSADARQLVEILRPSLAVWANEPGAERSLADEIDKAIDKIERSQSDWHEQEARKRPALDALARAIGKALPRDTNGKSDAQFIAQHAIVQKQSTYYVFDFQFGRYSIPKTREELSVFLPDAWDGGPIPLHYAGDDGNKKKKPLTHILEQNAINADQVIGDLTIDESRYDPNGRIFYEALAVRRVTKACYDADIDVWLRLLAGVSYDKLCDWIAAVPQLQHQLCVLYLDGVSGAGKGLLANGLSRLYRKNGPVPFANVIGGDFNSDIIECPFIFADEGIPHRKGNVSAELRALVGSSKITVNQKYITPRPINGCVRLMLAANNDEALVFDENLSVLDLEAIVGRFLHIHAQREAADWIKANNAGGQLTKAWVEGDLLAQHCLWLMENRVINPGKRFLVEGDETTMHRKLLMQGAVDGAVHEWLVRFATKPQKLENAYKARGEQSRALIEQGEFYVNTQAVIDGWEQYMPSDIRRPSTRKVGTALKKLSHDTARLGPRGANRIRYYVIKAELVIELSQEMQIGDEDVIQANLGQGLKVLSGGKSGDPGKPGDDAGPSDAAVKVVGGKDDE